MTKAIATKSAARRGRVGGRSQFQEDQRRRSRAAILAAAAEIFAKTPYVYSTIEDIIAAAGVGRATFYVHFESKLSLAISIYESIAEDWLVLFDRLTALPRQDPARMGDWIRTMARLYVDHGYVTPLVAQLEIFEEGFRIRLREDRDFLIKRLAKAGIPAFAAVLSEKDGSFLRRVRAHLLLRRIDQVCGELMHVEAKTKAEADAYVMVLADEMCAFFGDKES